MTSAELEARMVEVFGPDFREKAVVSPLGSFRLAGVFEECGLQDPKQPPPSGLAYGLWQFAPSSYNRP